ncbi:hypothetical protein DAPPUDRAFT_307050 [Daphnia pulex]|uniref:Thioredoxin domain-containing protein n=1 Tax=Daphnia pulex TaxID=6669 RepID=E9G0B0_DAPPU|nr:hypothetical protein DAPPUDRAFT_307050 [Daphnia pulex]|eukprot:EFX86873.1 hypothetical protein DAPPUDRAFT_307050 [Daphnia pulex]
MLLKMKISLQILLVGHFIIEVFVFGSLCEVIGEGVDDSVRSDDNISDPIMESLSNSYLNSSLLNDSIEITSTGNDSITNDTTISNATLIKKFTCLLDDTPPEGNSTFQIVNGTTLLSVLKQNQNITSRTQPATCQIVVFFASWCPFSIQAAPHLNALPRGFPMLSFYAIDAYTYNSLSTMQGVMAIPSFFLFHNGKAAARYNETEYKVDLFSSFITRYTGIQPIGILNRTTADYQGPLPTNVLEQTDQWLILAWIVLLLSMVYWFTRSNLFWTLMENIRNTWREAEAQHQHID